MTVLELDDGTEVPVSEVEVDREFGKMTIGQVWVRRPEIDVSDIDRGFTEAWILENSGDSRSNAEMGGIVKSVDGQGSLSEVFIESFERLAVDAKPVSGAEIWDNVSDKAIVRDAISETPELSGGDVQAVGGDLSFKFSHSTQAYKIRQSQEVTGAEIQFTPDKTVNYVEKIGSRRSTTIDPANSNIKGDIQVEKVGGDRQVTDVRVLGAGEGRHQVTAEASVDRFAPREKWLVVSNKDLDSEQAAQEFANTLIEDFQDDAPLEVRTTIEGIDVALGDEFDVFYPEEDVDRVMRVVVMTTKLGPTGKEYEVVLSTQRESLKDKDSKDRQDIQRYNQALEGNAVPINTSGGRQPVSSNHNYQMEFYYPSEVEFEHRLNVRVIGLPYRAYSQGADLGGGSIVQKDPIAKVFADNDGGSWSEQFDLPQFQNDSFGEIATVYVTIQYQAKSGVNSVSFGSGNAYIENVTTGTTLFEPDDPNTTRSYLQSEEETLIVSDSAAITDSIAGDTIEIRLEDISADTDAQWNLDYGAILEGAHRHPPLPGIIEGFGDPAEKTYPKECAVQVASPGGSVRSTLGIANSSGEDAAFRASFDARGQLREGEINRIQITSTNTGHILAYIEGDVYRQITGDG